jgi:uncharacterized protein with HEPN domain
MSSFQCFLMPYYTGIDRNALWQIASQDIAALKLQIEAASEMNDRR